MGQAKNIKTAAERLINMTVILDEIKNEISNFSEALNELGDSL